MGIRRDTPVAAAPAYDFAAIDTFVQRVHEQERAWQRWFATHDIAPHEIRYESLVAHPERTLRGILRFLDVATPLDFSVRRDRWSWRRHTRRQADDATDALESRYRADLASWGRDGTA